MERATDERGYYNLRYALRIFFMLIAFLYACHMMGCLLLWISLIEKKLDQPKYTYYLLNESFFSISREFAYLRSLYFAFMSLATTGYGDMLGISIYEVVSVTVINYLFFFLAAMVRATKNFYATSQDAALVDLESKFLAIRTYLKDVLFNLSVSLLF